MSNTNNVQMCTESISTKHVKQLNEMIGTFCTSIHRFSDPLPVVIRFNYDSHAAVLFVCFTLVKEWNTPQLLTLLSHFSSFAKSGNILIRYVGIPYLVIFTIWKPVVP